MKCKRCRERAEVKLPQHNASFCRSCFIFFIQRQVQRTIESDTLFTQDEPVLIAVSGGKDSLALWDILETLGYRTAGLHLSLGIGDYSSRSTERTQQFAAERGLELITVDLGEEGETVPELSRFSRRAPCSTCGLAKRHYMDRVASERGFAVLATGHNLDDEAARLMGNVMRWQMGQLAKQSPKLEARHERFARKVRPLYRISEYEMAVYAFFRGIDYIVEECPNSEGASQLVYKEALNRIEAEMPGSKLSFVAEFLRVGQPAMEKAEASASSGTCTSCGMPSFGELCAFCNLRRQVGTKKARIEAESSEVR